MRDRSVMCVVDLESTCWDGEPPSGELPEIIEVGVAVMDARKLEVVDKHAILVRPEHSQVSEFCTHLTSITPEMVEGGVSFREACAWIHRVLKPKDRLWASWGDYDRRMFERMCKEFDVPYPWGVGHMNVKTLFALATNGHEVGMDKALAQLGLPLNGHHHRGVDDALNIAAILRVLLARARRRSA